MQAEGLLGMRNLRRRSGDWNLCSSMFVIVNKFMVNVLNHWQLQSFAWRMQRKASCCD